MSTRYDELTEILGTGSAGTPSSTPTVDEQKQTSRRDELYSLLGESTSPAPDTAASGANTTQRDAVMEAQTQGEVVTPSVSSADSSPQGGASAATPQTAAPSTSSGAYAPPSPQGEGRSAEQVQQEKPLTAADYDRLIREKEAELARWEEWDYDATSTIERQKYDNGIKAYENEIERLKAAKWKAEKEGQYGSLKNRADYETRSSAEEEKPTAGFGIGLGTSWWGKGDPVYDYINDIDGTRKKWKNPSTMGHSPYSIYDYMDEDEIKTYNYLYNTDGKEDAGKYLDYIEYALNERSTKRIAQNAAEVADKHPVASSAASIHTNLVSGIGLADVAWQNLKRELTGEYVPIDYNRSTMAPSVMTSTIRGTVSQNITDSTGVINLDENEHPVLSKVFNGKSLGDVYQLGMSIADSTAVALTPFGQYGAVLLGGSAGTQGMLDALERGASDEQAIKMGLLNATFEALFEYVSLDKLLTGNPKNLISALLQQGGVEASEEAATTLANNAADILVMAEKSDYQLKIQAYMESGMSREDATKQALLDKCIELGWDAAGGFFSGGITGGGKYGLGNIKAHKGDSQQRSGMEKGAENAQTQTEPTAQPAAETQAKPYQTVEELIQPVRPAGNAYAEAVAPAAGGNAPVNVGVQARTQGQAAVQQVMAQEEQSQREAEWWANREKEAEKAYEGAKKRYEEALNGGNADETDFFSGPEMLKIFMDAAEKDLEDVRNRKIPSPFSNTEEQAAGTAQEAQRPTPQAETPHATQNATQTSSGELNTQTETNTQEQAENAEADEADELPVRAAFTPMVSPDSAVQTERTGEENGIGGEIPKGAKISQFWSNTLQKVEEYARVPEEGKTPPLWYMPKSEAQSLAEAASRLKEDRQGTIQDLVSSDAWSGVQLDSAASIASELYADAMESDNWEPVAAWDKVMANHTRESARGIQAIAKYSRTGTGIAADVIRKIQDSSLSPEQKNAAQKVVGKFGTEIDAAIAEKSVGRIRNVILKMNEHRGTGTFFKDNFEKVMKKIQDVDYLSEYARRQLSALGSDYTVSETRSFGDMLKTWQVNAQLTSLGTFLRNIGGNLSFGAIDSVSQNGFALALDHLVSKKTGKRTVSADIGWFSSDTRMRASDALYKSIVEVAGDVDMGGSATRYGITSGRTFKMSGGKAERFMSRWEQLLSYSLRTSDQVFRGRIEGATQSGLERIKNSGLSAEEISQIAENTADYRLFQNEGTAAKISKGAHDVLNLIGISGQVNGVTRQGGFGIGDLVNPYPKVPANLAVKALEYSPANIIKGGIELAKLFKNVNAAKSTALNQHQAVMDIARGMTGVPIIALCAALLKTGLVKNFDDEEDYDVMAQNAAEGKTGVQINLDAALRAFNGESAEWKDGDDLMSISWAEPINAFLAIGALVANEDDDATIGTYIGDYFDGALQSVLDMPLMSNLSGAIDTVRYSTAESLGGQIAEGALDYAASTATGFVPAPFRQTARAIDPYYRNTKGDSALETAWNNLANVIPGLRQLALDVKTDNFGQPKENAGGFAQRSLNALVLPGAINKLNQSDASATVEAIYEATGDAGVYPDRKAPNSISYKEKKHSLTAEEKQEYQTDAGQTSRDLISALSGSKYYGSLSDEQKAEVVKTINQYAEHKAADKVFDILGIDTKRDKWETLKGNDLINYLTVKALAKGIYNDNGEITDYSAMDELIGGAYSSLSTGAKEILSGSYSMLDELSYGMEHGVDSKIVMTAKEKADANGNGSVTQEELWYYLGLQKNMPEETKDVLWDILTTGKTGYAQYAEKQK